MKRSEPWFKCFPADWLEATRGITPEQRGIYFDCLCLIYQFGKALPDDDKWMSHQLHISTRLWRSVRDALVEAGKLVKTAEGYTNERAQVELESRLNKTRKRAEPTAKQARDKLEPTSNQPRTKSENSEKPNDFYARADAFQNTDIRDKKDNPPTPLAGGPTPLEALEAFELYNATALRCGLPQASKLTPDRQRKIRARLKDFGLDGWKQALANIEKSAFLTGGTDKGFRADLDFVVQAKSFGKLHDGGYGNGRHAEPKPQIEYLDADWIREARANMDY